MKEMTLEEMEAEWQRAKGPDSTLNKDLTVTTKTRRAHEDHERRPTLVRSQFFHASAILQDGDVEVHQQPARSCANLK